MQVDRFRDLARHNEDQRSYFARSYKRTMQPGDTPYLNRQVDEMVRFAGLAPGDRILDVGCGIGKYTFLLARRGFNMEGMDLTRELLDQLREHDGGRFNLPLYCCDILEFPQQCPARYDKIVGFFTLHHLLDLEEAYKAMAKVLKPGGSITFLEPNAFNPLYYVQIAITPRMTWQGDGGIVKMRTSVLFPAMRAAGLERCEVERFGFFPPFLTNRSWGRSLEGGLEKIPIWRKALPFQMFKGCKPA